VKVGKELFSLLNGSFILNDARWLFNSLVSRASPTYFERFRTKRRKLQEKNTM